ncbi:expressed unknown protein [Seminavis robusta]|uniref:Uncharacterized protein n=1 Tax=Seminavis robusta TaxID=568900 RepID=A0A9N8HM17_9STRA|nr:expressed unknown protein [Seminavis robusta]|eukprot:Sro861_g212180.1 n/a (249) ;mRNA; r:8501-9247
MAIAFGPRSTGMPLGTVKRRRHHHSTGTSDQQEPICFVSTKFRSLLRATVNFEGESSTSVSVPIPSSSSSSSLSSTNRNNSSLADWMLSSDSDEFFLGTQDFRKRTDGCWDAFQPSVDWFGLELVPVFVIKLERNGPKKQVSAIITQARSDIRSGQNSVTGRLAGKVMEKSSFQGSNRVTWKENDLANEWILEADLSLTLSIPLPPLVPLPPGFNSIGSRIVKSTCKRRLEQFLNNLQASYLDWAKRQ